jgi:putative peptidoglycan lipid II flippase
LVLAAYTLGLLASTATRLYINVLYAFRDTRTPAYIALLRVVVAAALGFTLMVYLEDWAVQAGTLSIVPYRGWGTPAGARPLGAAGLAAGAGLAAWYEWRLLREQVRRRLGAFGVGRHIFLRLATAALAAGAAGRTVAWFLPPLEFVPGDLGPALRAAVILGVFGVVYFGLARALGISEAEAALARLGGRLRRRG